MEDDLKKILTKTANCIRQLSIEAVEKANSGHPGLPLGCAEIGAYLWGAHLNYNPKNPEWVNRDRFLLSAGHGSAWIYAILHLTGYDLSLDEIKRFRQLHSLTPGHPEYPHTKGIEATTGPLGQGVGNAVGQALGLKLLAAKLNRPGHEIITNKVYCLAGDGCIQEGISSEVSALAGHLNLNNLVLIYDANKITLDGPLSQSGSEDTAMRYRSYGWDVLEMDGNNLEEVESSFEKLKEQERPTLVLAHTIIGKGSPNKAGSYKVHGSPLGPEELKLTKEALGLPEEEFYIPQPVTNFFAEKLKKDDEKEENWNQKLANWKKAFPDLAKDYEIMHEKRLPDHLEDELKKLEIPGPISGRKASQAVLQKLGDLLPFLYGGSADLSGSDCTMMKQFPLVEPGNFEGRNIKYGIREFGMATSASGLFQTGLIIPYIGTFLTFSDYMRNAIRLAALSHYHVIYQFTHDSVFLGEDGPTHQPVEHYMTLRAIPNLHVFRPADPWEVRGAWISMLNYKGPSAILLSRQNLPELEETKVPYKEGVARGAYILKKEKEKADFTFFATGSEVSLALDVAAHLEKLGKQVRVISMPCWELFEAQSREYIDSVVGGDLGRRISIEAGISTGWFKWIGPEGLSISVDSFGLSAPASDIANEFGFTVDAILSRLL